jgi:excisionase family DNA binding protein
VDTGDRLLTPGEVAALFRVDPKTVTRWAAAGRISSIRTPGGHRRFRESEVRALLEGEAGIGESGGSGDTGSPGIGSAAPNPPGFNQTGINQAGGHPGGNNSTAQYGNSPYGGVHT